MQFILPSQKMKHFISLLFLWSFAYYAVGLHLSSISHRVTVHVTNRIGSGYILTVHCRSKDDDLGTSDLKDEDEISWSFRTNIWGTTLFYCNIEWGGTTLENCYRFDAYDDDRDYRRCWAECRWMITSNGTLAGYNECTGYWEPFALQKGSECWY